MYMGFQRILHSLFRSVYRAPSTNTKNSHMRLFLNLVILMGIILFAAICLHSVEEIHYLKSFFPPTFTVQESFYAAGIELIKIIIIGLPIVLIIGISLRKLRELQKGA